MTEQHAARHRTTQQPPPHDACRLLVLGANQNSGNLGVSALGTACVDWILKTIPTASCCLQNGMDEHVDLLFPEGSRAVDSCKLHGSGSLKARFGTRHLLVMNRIGGILPFPLRAPLLNHNRTYRILNDADAILDVSAGDSFADIYPDSQFAEQCDIKQMSLGFKKPVVLLPQTLGPFNTAKGQALAQQIIPRCKLVATRELNGLSELERVLGKSLDHRFVECPDVAFGLRPVPVDLSGIPFVNQVDAEQLFGLNVSELLYNRKDSFGLSCDYAQLTHSLIDWILSIPQTRILLIPHVLPYRNATGELTTSDLETCQRISDVCAKRYGDRIAVAEHAFGPGQIKYLIGKMGFFIGARMHACIAAISQGVPTATLAYSKKAAGVMGMAGLGESAIDLRQLSHQQAILSVQTLYNCRVELAEKAKERQPVNLSKIEAFFRNHLYHAVQG